MTNIITFIKSGDCPPGWTENTDFIDRIPVGETTASESGDTGGETSASHSHTLGYGIGAITENNYYDSSSEGSGGGGSTSLTPPYVKVKFCEKIYTESLQFPVNSIMMFIGDDGCPGGWTQQTDFDGFQPRGATSSLGTTGTANTDHNHTYSSGGNGFWHNPDFQPHHRFITTPGTTSTVSEMGSVQYSFVKVLVCKKD